MVNHFSSLYCVYLRLERKNERSISAVLLVVLLNKGPKPACFLCPELVL